MSTAAATSPEVLRDLCERRRAAGLGPGDERAPLATDGVGFDGQPYPAWWFSLSYVRRYARGIGAAVEEW